MIYHGHRNFLLTNFHINNMQTMVRKLICNFFQLTNPVEIKTNYVAFNLNLNKDYLTLSSGSYYLNNDITYF